MNNYFHANKIDVKTRTLISMIGYVDEKTGRCVIEEETHFADPKWEFMSEEDWTNLLPEIYALIESMNANKH